MDDEFEMTEEQKIQAEIEKEAKKQKTRKLALAIGIPFLGILFFLIGFIAWRQSTGIKHMKPVIYLYPETTEQISVQLDFDGELTCTYPEYKEGWTVTACPDGTLTDENGMVYSYLYWEGESAEDYDFSEGFCVKGSETAAFLEQALEELGLTRREANEFIVYWLPMMEENKYNVISFQTDAYTNRAKLTVNPEPDTAIRVFMVWKKSNRPVAIKEQKLSAPTRTGFTLVEWGGAEMN